MRGRHTEAAGSDNNELRLSVCTFPYTVLQRSEFRLTGVVGEGYKIIRRD